MSYSFEPNKIPHRLHPSRAFNQNAISGGILFFTVGIYLAVLGLGAGAGKPTSQRVSDISNLCLYSIFCVFGFFTGTILNKIGPVWTIMLGIFGYPFYVSGLFYYDRTAGEVYPIFGGIVLGISAPLLWAVSGFIQWAYATEAEKGAYIAWQYFINQIGSVIGALVAFGIIFRGKTNTEDGSPTSVYITFIILQCVAFILALGLKHPKNVRRADGTAIAVFRTRSWNEELFALTKILRDPKVLAILPVMFASEMPLAVIPSLNAKYFNLRTRAMNNVVWYALALPGTLIVAYFTDKSSPSRRVRGFWATSYIAALILCSWVPLLAWMYAGNSFDNHSADGVDWSDSNFGGPFVIYQLFGLLYACYQLVGMWILGTFSNDPTTLAVYAGLWKGVAASGLAVTFGIAAAEVDFKHQCIIVFCLQFTAPLIMYTLVARYCTETNYGTESDVIAPLAVSRQLHQSGVLDGIHYELNSAQDVENSKLDKENVISSADPSPEDPRLS